jgi:hypothetical protein
MEKIDFMAALHFGWAKTKENFSLLFLILLLTAVVSSASGRVDAMLETNQNPGLTMANLVLIVFSIFIQMGAIKITLLIHDGLAVRFSNLFDYGRYFLNFLLANLIYAVVVMVGFVLLIIPGIIWSLKYQFMPYLVLDRDMKPMDAFKESARITDGHKGRLFLFGLFLLLVNIAGLLALIIGLLFTIPASMIAYAYVYRKLLGASVPSPAPLETAQIA